MRILRRIFNNKSVVHHTAPFVPVREVGNKFRLGKVGFNRFLHSPIDIFNLVVGRDGIHGAEHLRQIHHIARVKEGYLLLPPFFSIFAAHVLRPVLSKGVQQDFFLQFHQFGYSLYGHIHEGTIPLYTYNFFNKSRGFRRIIQPHDRRLELLQQFAGCLKRPRHILEQKAPEAPLLWLLINAHLCFGHDSQRTL